MAHDKQGTARRTSLRWLLSIGTALIVAIYLLVAVMYANSARAPEGPDIPVDDSPVVALEPVEVLPAKAEINTNVTLGLPDGFTKDAFSIDEKLTLVIFSETGSRAIDFAKGTTMLSLTSQYAIRADTGNFNSYPLDEYGAHVGAILSRETPTGKEYIPVDLAVWGDIGGWRVYPGVSPTPHEGVDSDPILAVNFVDLKVSRNGSTTTIVVLLLLAMLVACVLAISVAVAVTRQRRKPEATLASWFAALLFALVPLRLNMPGSPPIGVWLDFLIFLWVVLALMAALSTFVLGWLRFGAAPDPPKDALDGEAIREGPPPALPVAPPPQ